MTQVYLTTDAGMSRALLLQGPVQGCHGLTALVSCRERLEVGDTCSLCFAGPDGTEMEAVCEVATSCPGPNVLRAGDTHAWLWLRSWRDDSRPLPLVTRERQTH